MGCSSNSESGCGPGEVGVSYFSVKTTLAPHLRERRYAPVRANVRDPLTTLNIDQLKLVSNIERSYFTIKRRSQ
jgi:hypothetical protein